MDKKTYRVIAAIEGGEVTLYWSDNAVIGRGPTIQPETNGPATPYLDLNQMVECVEYAYRYLDARYVRTEVFI